MLTGYDAAAWESFAVAEVGAAAALAAAALIAVSGIAFAIQDFGGLYWLAAGIMLAFLVGLGNAWVALIEILR